MIIRCVSSTQISLNYSATWPMEYCCPCTQRLISIKNKSQTSAKSTLEGIRLVATTLLMTFILKIWNSFLIWSCSWSSMKMLVSKIKVELTVMKSTAFRKLLIPSRTRIMFTSIVLWTRKKKNTTRSKFQLSLILKTNEEDDLNYWHHK